ncbi:MAG: EVE domain-containing protein [Bacteroidota bacterium]
MMEATHQTTKKYWLTVVSKDHIMRGVDGGFMQANHGKEQPLKKMKPGDAVVFYSPKQTYAGDEKLQAFTAIGEVADDTVYQHKMSEDFTPYRRNINYYPANDASIQPLIKDLEFIKNKQSWGYAFRFGFFEINQADYHIIRTAMGL